MKATEKLPVLCIIDSNTLSALGLKSIITGVARQMSIMVFDSVSSMKEETNEEYIMHYFVNAEILLNNLPYFQERKRKTIALVNQQEYPETIADFHHIRTNLPEAELVRSMLKMMQPAHNQRQNLPKDQESTGKSPLSKRELEVLCLVVRGHINKEIADQLNISLTTVISHRKNITEKLGIRSVSGLTVYAVTHGYVNTDDII